MQSAKTFIDYALRRASALNIPSGAVLPTPLNAIGTAEGAPWVYLFGASGVPVTQELLDERYENHYKAQGWTRKEYDRVTAGWVEAGKWATDCQGLLDGFLHTEVTADWCYRYFCTDKGRITDIDRPWVLGEAVFREKKDGSKMAHVGWVCGFDADGKPLVVEAKGIRYGVVVTKFATGNWTHRGLVTKKLEYEEEPSMGWLDCPEAIKSMQTALNLNGITDYEDEPLKVDGKWGKRSQSAFDKMCREHGPTPEIKKVEIYIDGKLTRSFNVLEEEL